VPFETWTSCNHDAESLARALEAHLNEFAERVISVAYAVTDLHYVLAVYEPVDAASSIAEEAAVTVAEQIIDGTHT
jgi:hypothetical protein